MASKLCTYRDHCYELSYDLINPACSESILILHGWGSNREIMKQAFSKHFPDHKHIYLDMPGFGKSSNDTILTTEDYAAIVRLLLDALNADPCIVMGHSFGGKVATLLNPSCLVLLSSSGVLVPKPFGVKFKIILFKLLKPFGFSRLRQLFVSDDAKGMRHEMYETFKNVVNEEFERHFSAYRGKSLLFWGREDTATPLWTAEKITTLINNSTLYPLDGDHYFFLNHPKLIADTVLEKCREPKQI